MGAEFCTPVQTVPGAHPASYIMGTGSFQGVKRPRRGVDYPPPFSATVKERVKLYLYARLGLHGLLYIITMAQQPYMGSGLLLPPLFEVTKSCAFVAVGDWPTGRATILSILMCPPELSGRQSGDLGEKRRL